MNLLEEQWIPIRRASGLSERIAPHEITGRIDSDPVVALDAPRPDFNGALIQFLIGLVQTAWVRADEFWDRDEMLWSPPGPERLQALFSPLREAFELDGDGPRFMQDLTLRPADNPAENDIAAMLIEFPGTQGIERNADHFVKRSSGGALCPHCAATAILCLMTNAPSGGAGHRTSIRGGGPLTTLIVHAQIDASHPARALWRDVSCNVLEPGSFQAVHSTQAELSEVFPWLRGIEQTMKGSGEVQPLDVHPLQVYWATPRRIRLHFANRNGSVSPKPCAICARTTDLPIERYITKNYGLNYKGAWLHPLSPCYRGKPTEPLLPVHPQPDGMTYRHWLGWSLGSKRAGRQIVPAAVVQAFHSTRVNAGQVRLWAFGYDMDKMKARCWYETTFPLFDRPAGEQIPLEAFEMITSIVDPLIAAAESVAQFIRFAVRDAWFGNGEARGDPGFVEASFWNRTEREFFVLVEQVIGLAKQHGLGAHDQSAPLRRKWLETLRLAALRQFDEVAARGSVEAGNPAKLAAAHRTLCKQLFGDNLQETLGLIAADRDGTPREQHSIGTKRHKTTEAR
ncbi:MAG: type I-E CRISPR-associated protein Cse1/CasA [Burkholderiales bacterium]